MTSLHSTMVLLIQVHKAKLILPILTTLHSTMFLLIRLGSVVKKIGVLIFTFHNVSINTSLILFTQFDFDFFTFHNVSINTVIEQSIRILIKTFTFHNVSINTSERVLLTVADTSLHSTMFLLIRLLSMPCGDIADIFTFHNVSINTGGHAYFATLHTLHSTMFLLIPRSPSVLSSTLFSLHSTMFLLIQISELAEKEGKKLYIPQCFY